MKNIPISRLEVFTIMRSTMWCTEITTDESLSSPKILNYRITMKELPLALSSLWESPPFGCWPKWVT